MKKKPILVGHISLACNFTVLDLYNSDVGLIKSLILFRDSQKIDTSTVTVALV